jgi:diacylglycerol kinase family enzyme
MVGAATKRRRMALVANAKAGALLASEGQAGSLEQMLREHAAELHVIDTKAGDLPARMRSAMQTGAELVVVAGGDGSIACAAGMLAGTDVALGVIACGTMNLLARDLGLDPANPAHAVRTLAAGDIRAIDAGCVEAGDEVHLFLCASMLGTPARLSRHREAGRHRGNGVLAWAGFGRAAAQALWRNRSLRLVLRVDGRVIHLRTPALTIVVGALDDSSGRMFGRGRLDEGVLSLYAVRRAPVWRQAWLLLRTVLTGRLSAPEIELIQASEVDIQASSAALHVLVDGEMRLLAPPLRYSVRPGAVRVVAPVLE